jgi:hypothetical protein
MVVELHVDLFLTSTPDGDERPSSRPVPLGKTPDGPHGKFERFGTMKNIVFLPGNEPKPEVNEPTAESVHSLMYIIVNDLVTDICTC